MTNTKQSETTDLRLRLAQLDAKIEHLREVHLRQGDRLAGRLMATCEEERKNLLALAGNPR